MIVRDPQTVIASDPEDGSLVLTRKTSVAITVLAGAGTVCDHQAQNRIISAEIPCDPPLRVVTASDLPFTITRARASYCCKL